MPNIHNVMFIFEAQWVIESYMKESSRFDSFMILFRFSKDFPQTPTSSMGIWGIWAKADKMNFQSKI